METVPQYCETFFHQFMYQPLTHINQEHWSLLQIYCKFAQPPQLSVISQLLAAGCRLEHKNGFGHTVLICAARNKALPTEVLSELVSYRECAINQNDYFDRSVMSHYLENLGQHQGISVLLKSGYNLQTIQELDDTLPVLKQVKIDEIVALV